MCGIAGVVMREPGRLEARPAVLAMQRALRHRGPDGEGDWSSAAGHACFAHTRLAVLDLTSSGRQPMATHDGRLTITYNGEIYNFRELRQELEGHGVAFESESDTEVILRAYETFGDAAVSKLRGMFAFAIWDERERTCVMARDRFGIKPLYFHAAGDRLVFASEVRAVTASGLVPRELDGAALYGYFRAGSVPEPRTLLRGLRSLEAGCVATWRDGRLTTKPYWSLAFGGEPVGDPVAATREALIGSVRHHFVSDVPVGIFLSGGLDSTALVALAALAGRRDVRTLTLALPGQVADDGPAARSVAAQFGTSHVEWPIDASVGRSLLSGFMAAADQPSIDGLNTFAAATFARDCGMKVMLSGLGADELFGGYPSFHQVPRLAAWQARLARAGLAGAAAGVVSRAPGGSKWRRLADLAGGPGAMAAAYEAFRGIFTVSESLTLAGHFTGEAVPMPAPSAGDADDATPVDAVSRFELTRYVRNQLLRDGDVMSMAKGVELRTPFLDAGVVSTVARIPAAVRARPGKRLLVEAVPEVPPEVSSVPKRCFQFPFEAWLKGEWRDVFIDVERTSPVRPVTWYRQWCLFALGAWLARGGPEALPVNAAGGGRS